MVSVSPCIWRAPGSHSASDRATGRHRIFQRLELLLRLLPESLKRSVELGRVRFDVMGELLATQSRRLVPRAPGGLRLGDDLDAELASAQQRSGGWADHRPGGLLGRPNRAMRLVGGIGLFSERLGLGLGLLVPGLVECRGSPAHGAVSVSVVAVKLERPFENLGAAPGLVGVGSCKLLLIADRLPELGDNLGYALRVGSLELGESSKAGQGRVLLRSRVTGHQTLDNLEAPLGALDRLKALRRPIVGILVQKLAELGEPVLDLLVGLASRGARFLERIRGGDELVESQNRGEGVEKLRRSFFEHRAELVIGQKGTVGRER